MLTIDLSKLSIAQLASLYVMLHEAGLDNQAHEVFTFASSIYGYQKFNEETVKLWV